MFLADYVIYIEWSLGCLGEEDNSNRLILDAAFGLVTILLPPQGPYLPDSRRSAKLTGLRGYGLSIRRRYGNRTTRPASPLGHRRKQFQVPEACISFGHSLSSLSAVRCTCVIVTSGNHNSQGISSVRT